MKRSLTFVVAFIVGLTGVLIAPTAASAALPSSCPGSRIDYYYVGVNGVSSGERYGIIDLYYSSRDGGTNCAKLRNVANSAGAEDMFIGISLCGGRGCVNTNFPYPYSDHGYYYSYAGTVRRKNANGQCVYLRAHMWQGRAGVGKHAWRTITGTHCG